METRLFLDRSEKKIVAETIQDVEPILEQNKLLRTMEQRSDWGREVADIPNVIATKWLNEEYARGNTQLRMFTKEWSALVKRKLQDPDWAYLRTDKPSLMTGFR